MSSETTAQSSILTGISDELANAVERAGSATVAVRARRYVAAAGVIWAPGVIVTAEHVVEQDEEIMVVLPSGQDVKATLAGRDAGTDLAVLRFAGADAAPAQLGDSGALRVGGIVLAVARPGGAGVAATMGIVSALGGAWRTWRGGSMDALIRVDLTLYPGFSGGPLVDSQGSVVGINTSGLSRGHALTIPTQTIRRVTEAILAQGHVSRGYLGVGMQPVELPADLAAKLALTQPRGLMLVSVEEKGPAAKAGLLLGDILIQLDQRDVTDTGDVQALLGSDSVGKILAARVIRGGALTTVSVTVGDRQ
jgi:S1-C subfamily serine protease